MIFGKFGNIVYDPAQSHPLIWAQSRLFPKSCRFGAGEYQKKKTRLERSVAGVAILLQHLKLKKKKKWVLGKLSDTRNEALRVQVEVGGSID